MVGGTVQKAMSLLAWYCLSCGTCDAMLEARMLDSLWSGPPLSRRVCRVIQDLGGLLGVGGGGGALWDPLETQATAGGAEILQTV